MGSAFAAIARLIFPVLLLVSTFAAIYLYLDTRLGLLANEDWLTVSHALVPTAFFVIAMTNRRYGATYAFAQVVLSVCAVLAAIFLMQNELRGLLAPPSVPSLRVATAFGASFFLASFISVIVFDGARGPRWWTAPLLGLLSSALVFALIFYPAAYGGMAADWTHRMLVYLALTMGGAVLALVPYWLLRTLVQPLSGFGGY